MARRGCRIAQPLEPLLGSRVAEPITPAAGALVSVQATIDVDGRPVLLRAQKGDRPEEGGSLLV